MDTEDMVGIILIVFVVIGSIFGYLAFFGGQEQQKIIDTWDERIKNIENNELEKLGTTTEMKCWRRTVGNTVLSISCE